MTRNSSGGAECCVTGLQTWLLLPALALLAACSAEPDMSGVNTERARALQRYDIGQTLAANERVVVAGLSGGALLVSGDAGATWQRQMLGRASLVDMAVCPDGSFIAADHYQTLWHADAQAEQWTAVPLTQPETPITVACDAVGNWWVAGTHATVTGSADHGQTWTTHELGGDVQITALQFIGERHAVALGEFGFSAFSDDAGASWKKGEPMPDEFYPYAALFRDANTGWVSGIAGQMLHTNDGGKTWQKQENASQASLYRLFMHAGTPHGVGSGGTIARLDGDVWRTMPYPDPLPVFLGGGTSLPGQTAIVIGGPGGLLRTVGTAGGK